MAQDWQIPFSFSMSNKTNLYELITDILISKFVLSENDEVQQNIFQENNFLIHNIISKINDQFMLPMI